MGRIGGDDRGRYLAYHIGGGMGLQPSAGTCKASSGGID